MLTYIFLSGETVPSAVGLELANTGYAISLWEGGEGVLECRHQGVSYRRIIEACSYIIQYVPQKKVYQI